METNFNRIFEFSYDFKDLYTYNYYINTNSQLEPYFFSLSMLIDPHGAFPLKDNHIYIPTDNTSTEVNNDNPIIQGEILLPNSNVDPFWFRTNLISLEEYKTQDPLLINKKIRVPNMQGIPTEINIIRLQRIIQGTVRVAIAKELEIQNNLNKLPD
jgi:hypothetical protein